MENQRKRWVDSVKALAIFLVVIGHYLGDVPPARAYIYTFHMPLFFFISGFLFRKKGSWIGFVGKRARSLLLPYLIFSLLKYIYSILKSNYGRSVSVTGEHLKFYDIFTWHHYFWFLGVLFLVSILFYPISGTIRSKKELFILAIICTFFHYMLSKYYINFINENFLKCFTAMVFYSVGFFLRDKISENTMYNIIEKYPLHIIFFSIVNFFVFYLCYQQYGVISINFSHNYFYLYFLSFCGIILSLSCCQIIRENKVLSFVGANTIIIYLMEPYPQAIFGRIVRSLFHVDNFEHISFGYSILYTVLTIFMLSPVIYLINRYLPFVVGRKKLLVR